MFAHSQKSREGDKDGADGSVFARWIRATALLASAVVVSSSAVALGALGAAAPANAAGTATTPWTCDAYGYLFQTPTADSTDHSVTRIDLATGEWSTIGHTPDNVNAVGYDTLDNYVYGWDIATEHLVKVSADFSLTDLGKPAGLTAAGYNTGAFDDAGHLWITTNAAGDGPNWPWAEIDFSNPQSATYGTVLKHGTFSDRDIIPSDWAWVGGKLYGTRGVDVAGTLVAHLEVFDPSTGSLTDGGALTGEDWAGGAGAIYTDGTYLYGSDNGTGYIYRIDPATRVVNQLPQGPGSKGNDGARCATAPIPTITLTKQVDSRRVPRDQFTVGLQNSDGDVLTSTTTSGAETSVSTTNWPVSQGGTYTITDAMAAGSTSDLTAYTPTIACTDGDGNPVVTTGSAPDWTLTVADATGYSCTVTNTAKTSSLQPFVCSANAPGMLFQHVAPSDPPTQMHEIDIVTGYTASNPAFTVTDRAINAVGYNVKDNYVYGWDRHDSDGDGNSDGIVRVGSGGGVDLLGLPVGFGSYQAPLIGDVDDQGHYWIISQRADDGVHKHWFEIDLNPGASFMTILDSGPIDWTASADWAFLPGTNSLYTIGDSGTHLLKFGRTNHALTDLGALSVSGSAISSGAMYADPSGHLYTSNNGNGVIHRIDVNTLAAPVFSTGPGSTGNDGARCASSPIAIDFGDAPDSYGTTLDSDGGRHSIVGYDVAAHTATLMLGAHIDPEEDGQPGADADGDDTHGVADEDGVSAPIVATTASPTSVTVSATNTTDQPATLAGWIDLDGSGTFDADELTSVSVPANSGTADYELTFPAGTTTADTYARFRLFAGSVDSPEPTGAVSGGEIEDYPVTVRTRELSIEKTSDATAESRIGDTVHYTVKAKNTGTADYTTADPAIVTDSLTGVLDDASYAGDAAATIGSDDAGPVTRNADRLSWSGALAAGETVTITYSVVLKAGGDGDVRNVAWGGTPPDGHTPTCDPRAADGTDPVTGLPCGTIDFGIPTLTIDKKASTTELPANGGTVTYTVTVTNDSDTDFTASAPATASDDLSRVLDDADYNGDVNASTGTASFDKDAQELNWSGALPAHAQAVITYSVTYDAGKGGDHVLTNQACVPVNLAADPDDDCRSIDVPGAALRVSKSVDPSDGTAVRSGQKVTYTLTFESTGGTAATVDTTDDLSGVLDDATITGGPTSSDSALTPVVNGDNLRVTGSVPAGDTDTVTYTVTVGAFADQGDHDLANVLADCATGDPTCRTDNPVKHLTVDKTADPASGVDTGDTVKYTVTVKNDGDGDYTADDPAIVTDDLTRVLDDAAFDENSVKTSAGKTSYAAPTLTWADALAAGDTATITYTVTVTNAGDHDLVNTVTADCTTGDCPPDKTITIPLPHVVPLKTSDPASGADVQAGDVVTYTLTYTNDGEAAGPVDSTDDLSNVLDDADVTSEPVSSAPGDVTAVRTGDSIRVAGDIDPGQKVTVVYRVTVKPNGQHGDDDLGNVLTPDRPQFCDGGAPCPPQKTDHPVGDLDDWKTVSPASNSTVQPGTVLTYTLHFENSGKAPVSVDRDDDLSGVLDDAAVTAAPESSGPELSVSPITDGRFTVTGDLDAGAAVTVRYQVRVNPDGHRGDDELGNFIVDPGQDPPSECAPADDKKPDCTVNYVSDVVVVKSADPASGTAVTQGQKVTYTLTFTNVGTNAKAAPARVDETDHLQDVLDDATLTDGPTSGSALKATVEGETIVVTGALASGQTVRVRYTVTVKTYDKQGNHALGNVVARTGDEPICAPGSTLCTHHSITAPPAGLARTGSDVGGLAGLVVLLLGAGAVLMSRRRKVRPRS